MLLKYVAKRDGKVMSLHDSYESVNQVVFDSQRRDRENMIKSQYAISRAIIWCLPKWIDNLLK
jgi:hypothetical protein